MSATVADPKRSLDSEQISPATIAHHTVNENTPNLQQSHVCQWGAQPYLVGPLFRLVGKPSFSPWLSKDVLHLTKAANGPNSAISLTQTFDHILFYVCKSGSYGNKILYKNLKFFDKIFVRKSCRRRFRNAPYGEKILMGKYYVWA